MLLVLRRYTMSDGDDRRRPWPRSYHGYLSNPEVSRWEDEEDERIRAADRNRTPRFPRPPSATDPRASMRPARGPASSQRWPVATGQNPSPTPSVPTSDARPRGDPGADQAPPAYSARDPSLQQVGQSRPGGATAPSSAVSAANLPPPPYSEAAQPATRRSPPTDDDSINMMATIAAMRGRRERAEAYYRHYGYRHLRDGEPFDRSQSAAADSPTSYHRGSEPQGDGDGGAFSRSQSPADDPPPAVNGDPESRGNGADRRSLNGSSQSSTPTSQEHNS